MLVPHQCFQVPQGPDNILETTTIQQPPHLQGRIRHCAPTPPKTTPPPPTSVIIFQALIVSGIKNFFSSLLL